MKHSVYYFEEQLREVVQQYGFTVVCNWWDYYIEKGFDPTVREWRSEHGRPLLHPETAEMHMFELVLGFWCEVCGIPDREAALAYALLQHE